jgi:transposase
MRKDWGCFIPLTREIFLMVTTRKSGKTGRPRRKSQFIQKARGAFHPRVQKVGPEHFGIVCVDCHKERSKFMVADFYGNVLIAPTVLEHNRLALDAAISQVRATFVEHAIHDSLVAVERTGRYHHVVKQAFSAAAFDSRVVHPFATKQHRLPANPGEKTDDTDLLALHRASVNGFALSEPVWDASWRHLQLLVRYRRDLVQKSSALCCQIREHLDAVLPGLAKCFAANLWDSPVAWQLIRQFSSARALLQAGLDGLAKCLRQANIRFQQRSLEKVLAWAAQAAPAEPTAETNHQLVLALNADRLQKAQEIKDLERRIARALVATPYILLLSIPGVNVVSAAEFAAEMGPIENYATARAITGRAGLFPSRHQSNQVDLADGPLVRCANRRLRFAMLFIADNLVLCNQHFRAKAGMWRLAGDNESNIRVKVAQRFSRIAFQMVAGRQVFRHPCLQHRGYIVDKLNAFHMEHGTPMEEILADLRTAIEQIPTKEHAAEAKPLQEQLHDLNKRKGSPQLLRDILPIVLAKLGLGSIQRPESGEDDLTSP